MELALQLAKNNSIFQDELKRLIKVHHAIEYRPRGYPEDLSEELGIDDLIDLNVSFFSYVENGITYLPAEIDQLIHLTSLHISNNSITELPKEIGNLTKLEELWMGRNLITHLPEEIGQLQNLVWWDLPENNIEFLPTSIGNLRNLKQLNVQNNKLQTVPEEVAQLKQLETLTLSGNPILVSEHRKIKDWLPHCNVWF
ncbi:MAG TPA: hypothetical protein DCS93_05650 [Microscillaceae bacterium]|nr:hypothetical protein [Microscillaceae bacterium]